MNANYSWIVLVVMLVGCSEQRTPSEELLNRAAALPTKFTALPFRWNVVTSAINNRTQTMSILFGNEIAEQNARSDSDVSYPAGSVLGLVTWKLQSDKHWFGAMIPGELQTIEIVRVEAEADGLPSYSYELYSGIDMQKTPVIDAAANRRRMDSMLTQRRADMP